MVTRHSKDTDTKPSSEASPSSPRVGDFRSEWRQHAVFSPAFLELLARRDPVPLSTYEAALAGPWTIERRGDEYAVVREADGELAAVVRFQDTALLLAASLPLTGRGARYWARRESEGDGEEAVLALTTIVGEQGPTTVGRLRRRNEELLATLSTVEHLLRSPASLALLLEAAPVESLSQAFEMFFGRLKSEIEAG